MDINEARKIAYISKEEREAIQSYLNFEHTGINILANLTPEAYKELAKTGWLLPTTKEDAQKAIEKFVDIYSAMYKDSKGKTIRDRVGAINSARLVRGTSNKRMEELQGYTPQFFSMSTSEEIAKTFCEYSDSALVKFDVSSGVPFLNAEDFRSENRRNESEIIIAPFSRIDRKRIIDKQNGYTYYGVSVSKPKLEDIPSDELDKLSEEVIEGFAQNVKDIKEYMSVVNDYDLWNYRCSRANNAEDREFCLVEGEKVSKKRDELKKKIDDFRIKLQRTLKGLCRQKEKDIDQAKEVISNDKEERAKQQKAKEEAERIEREKQEAEVKRKETLSELYTKVEENPKNASKLTGDIARVYNDLLESEKTCKEVAQKLQIGYSKNVSTTSIPQKIGEIEKNVSEILSQIQRVGINQDASLEEATEISKKITPLLDGISYGNEIMKDAPDIVTIHREQSERELKRNLYYKVHTMIQDAKVQKLKNDRKNIESEKVGFFGKLIGKDKLKELRLQNNKLKIDEARSDKPLEQESYSVRNMLADLYSCKADGTFTPQMQSLYTAIKSVYKSGNEEFSDEYIKRLANEKARTSSSRKFTCCSKAKHIW